MDEMEEFSLFLEKATSGDPTAVGWLWDRHQPALLGWLQSMDRALADDVASDAWIDALRSVPNFHGTEPQFRSWLFTIARRRLIDRQRRESRRPDKPTRDEFDLDAPIDTEGAAISHIESRRAIAHIREILPKNQAEIILLRTIAGLDAKQVAEITGKRPATVRVLQHRGLRKLAEVLNTQLDYQPEQGV